MQELLQSFTVLPSRYCNGASLADSASATSGNGLNQDEPKQEADMNQDLNCVEGNTCLGSNLVAFPWDKENVRPDWSAAAISTPSDPLTEGPRGGHSPGIPKSRRIVGGRDRTSERKVRTVALALPFQPSVQDRGMPASGRISPLSPDEYKAWTVGRGGNVDNERMALLSRCGVGSEEIRNHCLRASVRDEPLPSGIIDEEDDGAAEEEPANSQERDANGERAERNSELRRKKRQLRAMYLRSEVNRTQSRMDALALLEQNRKLRIEVLGLKAALHFERKTKKMISKPKDDTRRPHQSNNRIFVPINNNGVGHQIDTDFMPKMQLGATALANAGQLDESYLEDSFASVQDGDNVTPSAISCHGSFSNQLHQDKTREALSSGSNCHETGLSDRKISMVLGSLEGDLKRSTENVDKTLPSISQVLSSTSSEKAEEDVKSTKQPNPDKAVVCQQIQTNCLNFQIGDDHPMEAIESIPLRYEETATANNPGVLQKGDDKHEGTRIPADLNCTTLMEINENIQDNSSKNCSKTEAQFEKVYSYRGKLLATTNNCSKKSDVEQSPLRHQESNVKVTSGNVASISKNTPKSINSDSTDLEAKDGEESGILNHEKSDPTQLSTLTDTSFDLIVGSNEASRIKTESELYESPLCRPDPDGCHADSVLVDSEKDAKVRISTSNKPRSMQFIDQASPILQNLLPTQMKESSPESQNSTNTNDNIMLLEAIGEKAIRYRANVTEERQGEKRQSVVNGLIGTPKSMVTLSEEVNKDTAQSHSNCDTEQEPSYNYPQWGFPPLSLSPIPLSTEELSAETIELAHLNNLQSHPEFEHIKVPSESIMEKVNIPQNGASIELRMHEDKEESVTRGEHEDKYCGNNSIEGACHNNRNIIEIEADRKQSDDVDINSREEFSHMKSHKSSSERNECNLHDQDLSTEPLQAVTKNSERIPDSLAAKMTENPQIYFIDKDAANILTDGIRNKQCGHGKENKSDQRKHCIEAVFCDSNKRRDGAEERKLSNQISIELRGITCRRGSRIKRKFNVENTSDDSGIVFDETQHDMIKTDNDDQIATITRCSGEEPSTISRVVKSRRKGKSNPTSRNEFNINLSTQEGRNDLSTKISKRRASDNDVTSNNDEDRNFRGGIYMDSANSSQEKFSVSLMTNPSKKLDSSEFLTDDNTRSSIEGCHDSEATIINDTYNSTPPKEKGAVNKDKDNYFQEISNHHTVTKPSETECLHAAGVNTSNKGGIACGSNKVINLNKTSKNESAEFCCQVRNIEFQKVGQQETPVVSSGAPNTDHNQLEYPNRCKGNRIIELNNKGKGKRSASSIFLIEGDASDVEPNNCFMEQADYSTSLSVTDIFHKKIEAKKKNEMPDMLKCQARIAPISKINLGPDCHTIKPEVEENMHLYLSERKFPDKVTNYPGIPLPLSSPPMRITRSRRRRIQSDSTAYEEKNLAGGEELLSRNDVIERQGKRRGSNQKSCASFDTVPSPGNDSRKGGIH